jgi:hypothetical protein
MEKENISKRMFLILSIMCFVPSLLVLIRGTIFGFGWFLPIAIFLWIASIICVLIAFYLYRKNIILKCN